MPLLLPFVFIAYIVLYAFALSIPPLSHLPDFIGLRQGQQQKPLQDTLDAWIDNEERIALDKLLANVKPGGRNVEGKNVADGTVIASPSTVSPDYWYQWVRDAAITAGTLVDLYADDTSSKLSSKLSTILDAYATLQAKLQHTHNPSGSFEDLQGLGEPKFQVDGTPFTGSWGRPQRDGPALRAITLMHYLRAYNASHPALWSSPQADHFFDPLYEASMPAQSIIKADLEYVSHFWNQSGFDLWEEIEGLHFFTLMVSLRALREGSLLARDFGDKGAAKWYFKQATIIEESLIKFWDEAKGHLVETLDHPRTGLDCGLLLGSLHALPTQGSTDTPVYPPWSDEVLVSLLALAQDQRDRFPINSRPSDDDEQMDEAVFEGVGIGRYPEDVYDGYGTSNRGGNPWFLCTASAAEVLYHTTSHLQETSNLTITPVGLPFYESLLATSSLDIKPGFTYDPSDTVFHSILDRLKETADEYLDVIKTHVDSEGSMSEQFDRVTGYMRGATDLTWSYGAFLQAVRARKEASGGI